MIKWLFQSTGIRRNLQDEEYFSQKVSFVDYGIIPFTNKITNLNNVYRDYLDNQEQSYVLRGGTKILKLFMTDDIKDNIEDLNTEFSTEDNYSKFFNKLKSGLFYDYDAFDQAVYQKLDLPLLNKGAIVISAEKAKYMTFSEPKFVKPSSDGKAFVGKILFPEETVEQLILGQMHNPKIWDETILIAPEKKVLKEWRFFVINGEVVTGSQYHENNELKVREFSYSNTDDVNALSCAKEYAKLYQPAEIFTLDICLEGNNTWSIVEYNCFNCSGLYKNNLDILKESVEGFVKNKNKLKSKFQY
jgi:hypothetical protein